MSVVPCADRRGGGGLGRGGGLSVGPLADGRSDDGLDRRDDRLVRPDAHLDRGLAAEAQAPHHEGKGIRLQLRIRHRRKDHDGPDAARRAAQALDGRGRGGVGRR